MYRPHPSSRARQGGGSADKPGRNGRVAWCALLVLGAGLAGVARAGPVEILGTTYYMNSLGWSLYKWLYCPLSFFLVLFIYWLLLRHIPRRRLKIGLVIVLQVVLAMLPLWNVYRIGQAAKPYCQSAGLKVYKTVQAEGFWGGSSIEYWSQYGFKYVEGGGSRHRKFRASIKHGKPVDEEVSEYISRYALHSKTHEPVEAYISRSRFWMQDEQTGEVLGELITYGISPGWWDRLVVGSTFGDVPGWGCGDEVPSGQEHIYGKHLDFGDLILATLRPDVLKGARGDEVTRPL